MEVDTAATQLMQLYPRIFFACHTRHVRDPRTRRLLSAHQIGILDHLDDVRPTTLSGLAAHMGVTASTMSIAIDRLVDQGYVRRDRDRDDARRVRLRLTAAGVRIRQAQSVLDPHRVRNLLRKLSAPLRDDAIRGLALLADAAAKQMHDKVLYGLDPRGPTDAAPKNKETSHVVEDRPRHRRRTRRTRPAHGPDRVRDP